MSNPIIRIHNTATGEIIDREMTADELAQYELDKAEAEARNAAQAVKEAQFQAVRDKLGLTADEAAALLG
jgi:hypothetical protein